MKVTINVLLLALVVFTFSVRAQDAFTYQGELISSDQAAEGNFDFRFDLYDDPDFGLLLGTLTLPDVAVSNGIFTVDLDYNDVNLFRGGPLFVEIRVGPGGEGPSTVLSPRQALNPAPLAISAQFADHAVTTEAGAVNSLSIVDGSVVVNDVDTSSVQGRVAGSCAGGETIRAINEDGSVACQAPAEVSAGAGLTQSANTLAVDFAGNGVAQMVSRSDHQHDDRYGSGPLQINLAATGTPAENGAALKAALEGITDADAGRRYQLVLSPGEYDVGEEGLLLKAFVSLRGAGQNSTTISGPGQSRNFSVDNAVVQLTDDLILEGLTIRCTGGDMTEAYAVLGLGTRWILRNIAIEIQRNGADDSTGFVGGNNPLPGEYRGTLQRVQVITDGGFGLGLSNPFNSDMTYLQLDEVSVLVTDTGIGIGDLGGTSSNSSLVVNNSRVEMTAGGTGIANYGFGEGDFHNVAVVVSGGTGPNHGFSGAGSSFRPQIIGSRISVSNGSESIGIRTNNGRVSLLGSRIVASTGLRGVATGTLVGTFEVRNSVINASTGIDLTSTTTGYRVEVDHSVIDAFRVLRTETTSGETTARFGNSKLDASGGTIINVTAGLLDAICVASYDRNYLNVSTTCGL